MVARARTNSPALIGQGVTAVSWGLHNTPQARDLVEEMLACRGEAIDVPDELMNLCVGVTAAALSGGGLGANRAPRHVSSRPEHVSPVAIGANRLGDSQTL